MTSHAVQSALDTLIEAIRAELREEFLSLLGSSSPASKKRGGRRQAKVASRAKAKGKARRKGAKRTPEELAALTTKTLAAIKKTPGKRVEELSDALGVGTRELALPILKLFEQKSIKTTGQRRGTKYFPK